MRNIWFQWFQLFVCLSVRSKIINAETVWLVIIKIFKCTCNIWISENILDKNLLLCIGLLHQHGEWIVLYVSVCYSFIRRDIITLRCKNVQLTLVNVEQRSVTVLCMFINIILIDWNLEKSYITSHWFVNMLLNGFMLCFVISFYFLNSKVCSNKTMYRKNGVCYCF